MILKRKNPTLKVLKDYIYNILLNIIILILVLVTLVILIID